ncbi:mRNA interferase [Duganella sp. CT11-25]|uniref:mRNA interferase n=1 Tax=unclassified Duganella TaxID=2636909 RepID=UPI0039AECAC9
MKWLKEQGVEFKQGSRHLKLYYKGERSHLPRHPSKELTTGLVEDVKRQLKLK